MDASLRGIYKINWTVQFILELDRNGLGVLIRDTVGAVTACWCSKIQGVHGLLDSFLSGVIEAIIFSQETRIMFLSMMMLEIRVCQFLYLAVIM